MTTAPAGPCRESFSLLTNRDSGMADHKPEAFLLSLFGQALIVVLLICCTRCVIVDPGLERRVPSDIAGRLPVVFRGLGGGGGGALEKSPPSHGALPRALLGDQLAAPSVMVPKEMPKLPVEQTVISAPDIPLAEGNQTGNPWAKLGRILSNGPGGPGGIGTGCCDGVGPGPGPGVGPGPGRRYLAGLNGVTIPRVIYGPEPSFSDEARKSKTQGTVLLLLVVGVDGRAHDIRAQTSPGMGLEEKAIEAVKAWRFYPATFNGQPVDTEIEIEVSFRLY